ncbi:thiamine-phosphate kinase [Lichenibacterium ramalinae]|uniref:Thiamine-monophosphate kinase n=1 Tax=Lichenibacterium ramalinae TaxID=2316527 RepID=A0A4Q2R8Q1_9HYPH|nr:thiamine-phosphate kinase [Lichenibacterium ramalinae]RYB02447.1 thiamine-phosphate kinase [Lichenibacterium ramalinae]
MVPPLDEDSLIARFFAPIAGPGGLGLKDDAAVVVPPPGQDLVVTVDALVAGGHFFAEDPPASIARKALRVNLSDLAAKGAEPLGFTLALALPAGWTADWLQDFARGLGEDAAGFACPLLGGDTVKAAGALTLSITAFGAVPAGRMVPRTGARAGDRLYVSGTIGDAALGLQLRLGRGAAAPGNEHLLDRYLHPQPRLALRDALRRHASGAMDVSDGLVGDLAKMMRASGASAEVDLAAVPLSPAARRACDGDAAAFDIAVTGGDDYEILASVPEGEAEAYEAAAAAAGVPVAAIGRVVAGSGPALFRDRGGTPKAFARGSFSHF